MIELYKYSNGSCKLSWPRNTLDRSIVSLWPQVLRMADELFHTDELVIDEIAVDSLTDQVSQIVVYNDDVNTFQWVIECFVDILNHTAQQAEPLSILIHYKGKAAVKRAPLDELRPMKDALVERGLSAVIEHLVE